MKIIVDISDVEAELILRGDFPISQLLVLIGIAIIIFIR